MCYDPAGGTQVILVGVYEKDEVMEGTLSTVFDTRGVLYSGKFKDGEIGDDSAWVVYGGRADSWQKYSPSEHKAIKQALARSA